MIETPLGFARGVLLSRGIELDFGSLKELIAVEAILREKRAEFYGTMSNIHARFVSGGSGGENLTKSIDAYKTSMLPYLGDDKKGFIEKGKKTLAKFMKSKFEFRKHGGGIMTATMSEK